MTHYGGRELAASFRQVRGNTVQIAEEIPDDKYRFTAVPDCRSIGQILVHVAFAPRIQQHIHGNGIRDLKDVNFSALHGGLVAEEQASRSKPDILALLRSEGEATASYLEGLTDAFLAEPVVMPAGTEPRTKTRFEMLLAPKEHEMHHRGQLMLLQRMIGLTPHLTRLMQERMARRAAAPQAT